MLDDNEVEFFKTLGITEEQSFQIEQETVQQSKCDKWFELRKNRITSSKAHTVFTRKRNFENLVETLLNPQAKSQLPSNVRDAMDCGIYNNLLQGESILIS